MHMKARMPHEPFLDVRMFMGRVVIRNQMEGQIRRGVSVNLIQESDPLLVTMLRHAGPDQPPLGDLQRGKQRRGPISFVM